MTRPSWGHVSRHCNRCGAVAPRVPDPTQPGYIHDYCRTPQEKAVERKAYREQRKAAIASQKEREAKKGSTP